MFVFLEKYINKKSKFMIGIIPKKVGLIQIFIEEKRKKTNVLVHFHISLFFLSRNINTYMLILDLDR